MTVSWALVAGGGTAGHVLPALAIADALVARGHDRAGIHYVGSARGIEAKLVPPTGLRLTLLPGRGIQRRLSVANVGALVGLLRALLHAVVLVRRERPSVVVAVGGYASVPTALAAACWRVPIIVAEQNAVPGAANRLIARLAKASAVSFPNTALPRAVVTGNPVRGEVLAIDRERDAPSARLRLGIGPRRRVVLVVGGSLGALRINRAAVDAVKGWRDRDDLAVRHVVGRRDWDDLFGAPEDLLHELAWPASADQDEPGLQYLPVPYEDDMPSALAAADLAVCRSGSGMCFELAAAGLPAVLVPSPNVTGDHQRANAEHLRSAGAAVVVADPDLDGSRLATEVDSLLTDPARRARMAEAARSLARPDAADAIARLAEDAARRRGR